MKKKIAQTLAILFVIAAIPILWMDYKASSQAKEIQIYLVEECRANRQVPNIESIRNTYPIFRQKDWYYWPKKELKGVTVQYPMLLPFPNAPGRPKLSEFIPVIYSYFFHVIC